MISQPMTIFRINKLGKPYVQDTDPSIANTMVVNDVWLNTKHGTMKMWNGTGWDEMQFGGSAIMDDCITNRMLANDISASKITAGILKSQDESFYLDMETGEAQLLNLILGGQVEGNIIATSSNGLTRVRIRGREGDRDVTAGIVFEQREADDDLTPWENAGQIYFSYENRQTHAALENYQVGHYNSSRPTMGFNAGSADGLMWRAVSIDWLKSAYHTYHGYRLRQRDTIYDSWTDVPPVLTAIGNLMVGTAVECNGIATCTYKMNDIMQIDFNLKVTVNGSGSDAYGISRDALRQINADIPIITPIDGGTLQIFGSVGALSTVYTGTSLVANGNMWQPACIATNALEAIAESAMVVDMTLVGTCYGKYSYGDDI